jgi:hypothetical protein
MCSLPRLAAASQCSGVPESPPLELGAQAGVVHRPARGSAVDYNPGLSWAGFGRIRLTQRLGLRLLAGAEYHSVEVGNADLGLDGTVEQPDLNGIRIAAELSGRLPLSEHWMAELSAGMGWSRFVAAPLTVRGSDVVAGERSGVLLDVPITPRLTWHVALSRVAISLAGTFAWALPSQTGDLFTNSTDRSQVLRQDTGELISVEGFPLFGHSFGAHLAVDVLL